MGIRLLIYGMLISGILLLSLGIFHLINVEPEEKKSFVLKHDDFNDGDSEEVVERTVVIKNIYVDDYSGYADSEESASYWYVHYDYSGKDKHTGYKIVEIDVPYFDLNKVRGAVKDYKLGDDDYLGLTFFKRVSFESYKAYKE
jgi:hypothetical protein